MVAAKADLYNLEEWEPLLTSERRKELYKEQRNSSTIVKGKKIDEMILVLAAVERNIKVLVIINRILCII